MDIAEARACVIEAFRGAQVFAHLVVGCNTGLFEAISRHGEEGVLPGTLALELGYFEDYVRVWCEAAYALRFLDHTGDGRFCLAEGFDTLLVPGMKGSMAGTLPISEIIVRERFEHPDFFRTGATRTFQDHGEQFSRFVADATSTLNKPLVDVVYKGLPEVAAKLISGARVLEIGCGVGRLLGMLAQEFPNSTFVGVDLDGPAIATGRRELEEQGLQHRVQLEQRGAEQLEIGEEFDVVSLFMVMHEIRADIRPRAVAGMCRALRPGGFLISTDMNYPSRLEDFRREEYYHAVIDQAAEVIWGNRHLSQEGLAELFDSCGFKRSEFHLVKLVPGQPSPNLMALAFR